jgi:hypothetical protein
MKKPTIFDFYIWNPLKKGLYVSMTLKLAKSDYREFYFLFSFIFFQIHIDFDRMFWRIKTFFGELNK